MICDCPAFFFVPIAPNVDVGVVAFAVDTMSLSVNLSVAPTFAFIRFCNCVMLTNLPLYIVMPLGMFVAPPAMSDAINSPVVLPLAGKSAYTFSNGVSWAPPKGTFRRFNDDAMRRMDEANEIWFGSDRKKKPQRKSFLSEVKEGVTPTTLWMYQGDPVLPLPSLGIVEPVVELFPGSHVGWERSFLPHNQKVG